MIPLLDQWVDSLWGFHPHATMSLGLQGLHPRRLTFRYQKMAINKPPFPRPIILGPAVSEPGGCKFGGFAIWWLARTNLLDFCSGKPQTCVLDITGGVHIIWKNLCLIFALSHCQHSNIPLPVGYPTDTWNRSVIVITSLRPHPLDITVIMYNCCWLEGSHSCNWWYCWWWFNQLLSSTTRSRYCKWVRLISNAVDINDVYSFTNWPKWVVIKQECNRLILG